MDKKLEALVKETVNQAINNAVKDATNVLGQIKEISKLKEDIETLKIEKSSREWDYKKREMEVEHKVGLERKRQEFESEQSKREATVSVREENLKADRTRFEEQMHFIQTRFEEEVKYLQNIMQQILGCLKPKTTSGKEE